MSSEQDQYSKSMSKQCQALVMREAGGESEVGFALGLMQMSCPCPPVHVLPHRAYPQAHAHICGASSTTCAATLVVMHMTSLHCCSWCVVPKHEASVTFPFTASLTFRSREASSIASKWQKAAPSKCFSCDAGRQGIWRRGFLCSWEGICSIA